MNKIEFINKLLKIEKITAAQKAKVIALAQDELSNFENSENVLFDEIKKIKRKIGLNDTNSEEDTNVVTPRINLTQSPSIVGTAICESDQVVIQNRILQQLSAIANRNMPGVPNPNAKTNDLSRQKELFLKVIGLKKGTYELTLEDAKEFMPEKYAHKAPEQQNDENYDSNLSISKIINLPITHNPKELVTLLKNFSVNDSALKYTTHSWDAGRDANMFIDLSEFLSIAKSQYSEFSYALKALSENLNGKIYNFLFNKEIAKSGWGDINPKKRIYFGWSSPELLEACKYDISLNPEDFTLPEKFQIQRSGKTLQKFKHIIDVFKNEIEVRDENSALLNLILQKHDNYLISFSAPKVSNLENKTFYTDIQWLSKALDLIFEGIQKYPQHPVVEYAVTENNNDRLVLTILHRNSFKNGLSIHDDKLNLKRGDFSTIKDKLRNLCDWSIESEFAEGAYRINYLVSDNEIPAYEKIMSAEGFKHILTFYK